MGKSEELYVDDAVRELKRGAVWGLPLPRGMQPHRLRVMAKEIEKQVPNATVKVDRSAIAAHPFKKTKKSKGSK